MSPLPAWFADAACLGADPEPFFSHDQRLIDEAKAVCLRCAQREKCLAYALETDQEHGVWGALSERQRTRLKHRKQLGARPASGHEKRSTNKSVGKAAMNVDTPTPADGPDDQPRREQDSGLAGSRGAPSAGSPQPNPQGKAAQ